MGRKKSEKALVEKAKTLSEKAEKRLVTKEAVSRLKGTKSDLKNQIKGVDSAIKELRVKRIKK